MKSYPLYCGLTHEPLEQISKSFRFPWLRANIDDEVDYDDENAFHNDAFWQIFVQWQF